MMTRWGWSLARLALLVAVGLFGRGAAHADGISIWSLLYSGGPSAAAVAPVADGLRDYLAMINARDGGVNGVPLVYEECSAALAAEESAGCYDKARASAIVVLVWSSAIALDALPKASRDGIALLAPGMAPAMVADGRYFPWAFALPATQLDGAQAVLEAISDKPDGLTGKTIALLRLDGPESADAVAFLRTQSTRLSFTLLDLPLGPKEMRTQAAQWQEIGRAKPDYVVIAGLGAMAETALAEARETNFPMGRLIGMWWSTNDAELALLGDAAKGYRALSWNLPGADAPALRDIAETKGGADKAGRAAAERSGLFYQRGVVAGAILVEAIRLAHSHFDRRDIDRTQLRWAVEHLNLDDAKLAALGLTGMIAPFVTSCSDHGGHAAAWLLEWNGRAFIRKAGPLATDPALTAPMTKALAKQYAEANTPWTTNGGCRP
jgi:branched-chain amino acid transport system substrate-binding protein